MALVQIDACRDRFDRRQINVIVGEDFRLIGFRKLCTAGAFLGVDVVCHVGIGAQSARNSGTAFAAPLLRCRIGRIGFLPLRRRQRRVVRCLRRSPKLGLKLGDAGKKGPYQVTGPILDGSRRIVLKGRSPRFDSRCQITGHFIDTLEFDLIDQ